MFQYTLARMIGERGGEATWPTDRIVRQPPMVEERKGGNYMADWPHTYASPLPFLGLWFRFQLYFLILIFNFIWSALWKRRGGGSNLADWPHYYYLAAPYGGRKEEGGTTRPVGHVIRRPPSSSLVCGAFSTSAFGVWSSGPSWPV